MKQQSGFSLMELLVVVIIIVIIAAIAIPSFVKSRKAANETSTIASFRTIQGAQTVYFATNAGYGTFGQLSAAGTLNNSFTGSSVVINRYTIVISTTAGGNGYCLKATPETNLGTRYLGMNQSGNIYASTVAADIDCSAGALSTSGSAVLLDYN